VPRVPDGQKLPGFSVQPDVTTIVVAAAVIEDDEDVGRLLVTRRQQGVHLEGYWEFPGGKCHPDEPLEKCLARELREELAVDATVGAELLTTTHAYADRIVELHFFTCELHDEPRPLLGQEMKWITRNELRSLPLPPADSELVKLLLRHKQ
jgi:mutator protein MutT